jgi:hypothetical protein
MEKILNSLQNMKMISNVYLLGWLQRISQHNAFSVMPDEGSDATYYRLGGYAKGVNIKQQDYLVLPPTLFQHIKSCGLNRKAMWPEKRPQWQLYSTVKKQSQAASGHPLVWVGFLIKKYK